MLLVAVYWRTSLTLRQIGQAIEISHSAAHRVVDSLGPLLALAPVCANVDLDSQMANPGADRAALSQRREILEQTLADARGVASRFELGSPDFPKPWEIAELGRTDALPGSPGERWLGKEILIDPTGKGAVKWHGVKDLRENP